MNLCVVGMADCGFSVTPDEVLVTYALGSCIAVAIYDPVSKVGGLLHYMLPECSIDQDKARRSPYMFADSGIPLLFQKAYALGAQKRRIVVRVAGGAQVMDDNGVFNIGRRNYLALRKILWKAGVLIESEEVGGSASRTVRLEVGTGRFWIRGSGESEREICVGAPKPAEGGAAWRTR